MQDSRSLTSEIRRQMSTELGARMVVVSLATSRIVPVVVKARPVTDKVLSMRNSTMAQRAALRLAEDSLTLL